jgi:2,3-dihydroxyphenylpropionate 1,2-dioxygenase
MPAAAICLSHGGLMNVPALLRPDELAETEDALARLRADAVAFAPDLVIQFGNDHNSGFSLTLMPPFMVVLRARTLGDFDTSSAKLTIDEARGRALVRHLHEAGVDVATSYNALFDHGFTMALDKLFGGVDRVPVIPVFINCGGDLRPPLHRALALGTAIGDFCAQHFPGLRILYLGSGGLSHDPPLPEFESAPPDVQQRMIAGTSWTEAALLERNRKVTEVGAEHGRGEGDLQPLNEDWDRAMLQAFAAADLEHVAAQTDREVIAIGGRGGSEIRNWIAALAALRAHGGGGYHVVHDSYRALPAWIVGFATLYAEAA